MRSRLRPTTLLLVLLAMPAIAATPDPMVRPLGPATTEGLSPTRAPDPSARTAGEHRRRTAATTTAAGKGPAFQDVDLRDAARPDAPVRETPKALTPERPALPARLTTDRSALPRPASRDLPWSPDRLLADGTGGDDAYVSLAVDPVTDHLYAVFEATDLGATDRDIHIARSSDEGQTWTVWEMPSFTQDESMPDIAIDDAGFLHVVWVRDDGYIVRTRSSDAGDPTDWAWIKGLFTDSINATPAVAVSGAGDFATQFIVAGYQEINWDLSSWEWTLIWSWSSNAGETIQFDSLVPDGFPDLWPDVALDGALVHMVNGESSVWGDPTNILLASDAVSGGFSDVTDLTDWTDFGTGFPRIACEGDMVYTVFQHDWDDGLGNLDGDVVFHYSDDAGQTVYGPYEMVADEYESVGPTVAVHDGVVACQWLEAAPNDDQFHVAARQAGGGGHPEYWPDVVEIVSDVAHAEPQFHSLDAAVAGRIHSAWIDRRDSATQGHNVYTSDRLPGPDLQPYAPAGWEDVLVVHPVPGERSDGWLQAGSPAYLSFGIANLGLAGTTTTIGMELHVDGALQAAWTLAGGLDVSTFAVVEDLELTLGAGTHDLELRLDPLDEIAEEDETNNTFLKQRIWIDGDPELRLSRNHVARFEDGPLAARAAALAAAPPVLTRRHLVPVAPELAAAAAATSAPLPVILVPSLQLDVEALAPRLDDRAADLRRAAVIAAQRDVLKTARDGLDPVLTSLGVDADEGIRELWLCGMLAADLTAEQIAALAERPEVARLWLDDRRSRTFGAPAPTSSRAGTLEWHLARIGADQAWARGLDGSGVLIGHLDSGAAYDHPDLAGNLWDGSPAWPHHGWDALDEDDDPYEGDAQWGHGTHTAGLVVGDGDAGRATGPAPGAELMILRAVPGFWADMIEAMQFALDHGPVDLFTMSAGWDAPAADLREASRTNAEILLAMGIPWICAAGNGDNVGGHHPVPTDIATPGDCPHPWYGDAGHSAVIAVGAVGETEALWASSSVGPTAWDIADVFTDYPYPPGLIKPDLTAPGDGVVSASPDGGYVNYSGTSMACPVAAGAAALLLQAAPDATPVELGRALEVGAVDLGAAGRDSEYGAGRLDVIAALDSLVTTARETVTLYNDGPLPLHPGAPTWNAAWLAVGVGAAEVAPGDSTVLVLEFDAAGLAPGLYYDTVSLPSDDPTGPHAVTVTLAIGDVTGVDAPPAVVPALTGAPNPFNPRTELSFALGAPDDVVLELMDLRGRRVRTLLSGRLDAGRHTAAWDGRDTAGRELSGGVYLARLRSSEGMRTVKLTLVR